MKKLYKIGYIAGVFDLFHIGHLNLIRNAKEQCEQLIVGVLTDELVVRFKKNPPFICEKERIQIIEALQYVDKAVLVTECNINKMDAWKLYQFDCLFSGDDWKNEPSWLNDKEKLNKVGSDILFFPYTKSTSSTQIKSLINYSQEPNIFIYGAGDYGNRALEYYGKKNVIGFIDKNQKKIGTIYNGKPVFELEKILNQIIEEEVVVAVKEYQPIVQYLQDLGIKKIHIFIK